MAQFKITVYDANGVAKSTAASLPTTLLTGVLQAAQEPAHTGDVTNSAGSLALTLATVNSNVGSFAATDITVDGKGRITAAASAASTGSGVVTRATSPTIVTPTLTSPVISGGSIDTTPIGATTPSTAKVTTFETTGAVVFNDAGANIDLRAEGDTDTELFSIDASQDSVGVGVLVPDASAKLEVKSTTKGFLPSRMSTTQQNTISSPANGLMIYDNVLHRPSSYMNSNWMPQSIFTIKPWTVLGSDQASISITLPAIFNEVWIRLCGRSDYGTGDVDNTLMQVNSDTTIGNYYTEYNNSVATTPASAEALGSVAGILIGLSLPCNTATAGNGMLLVKITNYLSTSLKRGVSWEGGVQHGTGTGKVRHISGSGWWENTSNAAATIVFKPSLGSNFKTGSSFAALGVF